MRHDPITFEVVRNALIAATDEMVLTLRRSAYSTNIKTRADFSCAFFDAELRAVAQGFNQPVHLGSMVEQTPRAVLDYGPENLGPGDVIVTNDPYPSGVHLNDVTLVSPVFVDDELLGYVANLAHHVDVGGGAPASIGAFREVFQEGVIIPPVKLVEAGAIVEDVFTLLLAQIRSKHETAGDLRAQVAANATGVRRIQALTARHGRDTVLGVMDEVLAYTERRARAELATLPHGVFEAEGQVDTDGYTDDPVRLRARVEIGDDGVLFDLEGCDPQRRAPVNSTYAQTFSACAYALKCIVDPDLPVNDGFYRLLRVEAPSGTVVNCTWPSPVVGGWETQTRLVDVVFRALLPALPERLPAGTKAMMCHAGFGGVDPDTGEYTCFLETFGGGYGGRAGSDGPDAVQTHGQNTENAPVEETERGYPVHIDRLSLVEDSDGPGRFRGGLGLRKDYRFDRPLTFTVLADRTKQGPWGVLGGGAGAPARFVLVRDGVEQDLNPKSTLDLLAGDVVSYRTCGGGGYGPATERDPALVLRDVLEGKVSRERARDVYRVAVDPVAGLVDEAGDGVAPGGGDVSAVDPISFEVIRNALVAATDEMVLALKRSAYSTNIKTRSDFSCAFFDARLRPIAQGFAQPVHLGSMVQQIPHALRRYGPERLGPGDMIITNDPYPSGVHLNDISLIAPVHHEGELLGYVANLAHHVDVGGGAPASIGAFREVFQEGVIVPPIRIVRGGAIVDDVFRLLLAQIRSKHETAGDLRAQVAANTTGIRRVQALFARHGRDTVLAVIDELVDYTERRARAELAALPHGSYESEGTVDTDGYTDEPVRLRARVEITAGRRPLRPRRLRPAAPRPGQLDLRADVLGLRVRREVPDRPGPAGERRLLPADHARRAGRHRRQLHVARAGRRRLGDPDPADRRHVPRAPARVPGPAACGDEGDDGAGGLREPRRRGRQVRLLLRHLRRRLRRPFRERRPRRGAGPRPEHRERADRGDRAQLPGADPHPLARRGLGRRRPLPRRARAPQGLPLRPAHDVHDPRGPRQDRPGGGVRRRRRPEGGVRPDPRRRRVPPRVEDDRRPGAR